MNDERIVLCETCQSEGRIYRESCIRHAGAYGAPEEVDEGQCEVCEGTGGEIVITHLIEEEDFDACFGPPRDKL
jgi:hypothetical protein